VVPSSVGLFENKLGRGLRSCDAANGYWSNDPWYRGGILCGTGKGISVPSRPPFVAEALGAWFAVKLCCDFDISHVNLEGDSMNVVNTLKKIEPCSSSSFGHLIEDTRLWLKRLHPFTIHHVRRDANIAAHKIAKLISYFTVIRWGLNWGVFLYFVECNSCGLARDYDFINDIADFSKKKKKI